MTDQISTAGPEDVDTQVADARSELATVSSDSATMAEQIPTAGAEDVDYQVDDANLKLATTTSDSATVKEHIPTGASENVDTQVTDARFELATTGPNSAMTTKHVPTSGSKDAGTRVADVHFKLTTTGSDSATTTEEIPVGGPEDVDTQVTDALFELATGSNSDIMNQQIPIGDPGDVHTKVADAHFELSTAGSDAAIVGIYGLPGAGKSHLIGELKKILTDKHHLFFDGSKAIADVTPGGLEAFKIASDEQKVHYRGVAIKAIKRTCAYSRKVGLVAGHLLLWDSSSSSFERIDTLEDWKVFTHVIYLNVDPEVLAERCSNDGDRVRVPLNKDPQENLKLLKEWQALEKKTLYDVCSQHGILFVNLCTDVVSEEVVGLVYDFDNHTESDNLFRAELQVDDVFSGRELDTVMVFDGDKTLGPHDTGAMFWTEMAKQMKVDDEGPLRRLFSGPMGYSYVAFRQATMLYEAAADEQGFDQVCERVSAQVTLYPEILTLLQEAARSQNIAAVVMTCGLRRVWQKVLKREGLAEHVEVVGGGRISDRIVVNAQTKALLVAHLQNKYKFRVVAFGDSPLDINMLRQADQAIVVVGDESIRSKTMEAALKEAIETEAFEVKQLVLPASVSPRLTPELLPLADGDISNFVEVVVPSKFTFEHATDTGAAKLLTTTMRNAANNGPALQAAHHNAGSYLAVQYVSEILGLEEISIPHVQGHTTTGHRLQDESKTLIVAMMRGGEPMARGVYDTFPSATFLHASGPEDVTTQHLKRMRNLILVDSVINTGGSIVKFIQHIRRRSESVRIVVVTGVLQKQCNARRNELSKMGDAGEMSVVALRLSENQFVGVGGTDTGNRLFNTTHLEEEGEGDAVV